MTKAKTANLGPGNLRVTGMEKGTDWSRWTSPCLIDQIERIKIGELLENQSEFKKCGDLLEDNLQLRRYVA